MEDPYTCTDDGVPIAVAVAEWVIGGTGGDDPPHHPPAAAAEPGQDDDISSLAELLRFLIGPSEE